jgi:hypothetical protein
MWANRSMRKENKKQTYKTHDEVFLEPISKDYGVVLFC